MNNEKIEKLIKEKLEKGGGTIPSQPQWDLIASKINVTPVATTKKKRIIWIPWAIAAAVAGIAMVSYSLLFQTSKNNIPVENTLTNSERESNNNFIPEEEVLIIENENEGNKEDIKPINKPSSNHSSPKLYQAVASNNQINKSSKLTKVSKEGLNDASISSATQDRIESSEKIENDIKEVEVKEKATEYIVHQNQSSNKETTLDAIKNLPTFSKKEFSLGFSGAFNYSNHNPGYVVAVSARQELGDNFFVDGSLGMIYNNSSSQVIGLPTNMQNVTTSSTPVKNAMVRAAVTHIPAVNTVYLQFNPVVGYNVSDDISLSTGPDIQKLMNQGGDSQFNYYAFSNDGTIGQLPNVDIGLTTQTEIDLGHNLKAGLMYRQGLNHWFAAENVNAINRNYFQFQFKYSLGSKALGRNTNNHVY